VLTLHSQACNVTGMTQTTLPKMTSRALLALLTVAKFESGRGSKNHVLNVSPAMWGSLRRAGVVDGDKKLTSLGWEIEGMYPTPEGLDFHANR
jgi:hypothetical protein